MVDVDRLHAETQDAQVRTEMALTRLQFARSSRDALIKRWKDAQSNRRLVRQGARHGAAMDPDRQSDR